MVQFSQQRMLTASMVQFTVSSNCLLPAWYNSLSAVTAYCQHGTIQSAANAYCQHGTIHCQQQLLTANMVQFTVSSNCLLPAVVQFTISSDCLLPAWYNSLSAVTAYCQHGTIHCQQRLLTASMVQFTISSDCLLPAWYNSVSSECLLPAWYNSLSAATAYCQHGTIHCQQQLLTASRGTIHYQQ